MSLPLSLFSVLENFAFCNEIFVKAYEQKVEIVVTVMKILNKEKVHICLNKNPRLLTPIYRFLKLHLSVKTDQLPQSSEFSRSFKRILPFPRQSILCLSRTLEISLTIRQREERLNEMFIFYSVFPGHFLSGRA